VSQRALVRNAADPKQVRFAERMERRQQERYQNALAAVLATPEGRVVLCALIKRAGVYRSVWAPSAEIHYRAGRQDYGHELMAELIGTNELAYQQMEREEWEWLKLQERSIDAQHTDRAKTEDSYGRDDERPG
jgi:hypothetical protein